MCILAKTEIADRIQIAIRLRRRQHRFWTIEYAAIIQLDGEAEIGFGKPKLIFQRPIRLAIPVEIGLPSTRCAGRKELRVIGVYLEGFRDLDGLAFAEAVRAAVLAGKIVLFYKAGRTPEGKSATAGHTASLAGDYRVCESCVYQAGAIVAQSFTAFEDLLRVATYLDGTRIGGNRIAGVSGAGFEAVVVADTILGEDYALELAPLGAPTRAAIASILAEAGLEKLVSVENPLDINPLADDLVHEAVIRALLEDPQVDAVVAGLDPLSPAMRTLPGGTLTSYSLDSEQSIVRRLPALAAATDKPVVTVVDGGPLYDPLAEALEAAGLLVFRSADRAVRALGMYIDERLRADRIREATR